MELLFFLILIPLVYVGVIYLFSFIFAVVVGVVGTAIATVIPYIVLVVAAIIMIYIIYNRKTLSKAKSIKYITITIITLVLVAAFNIYQGRKTNEFQMQLYGNSYSCHTEKFHIIGPADTWTHTVDFTDDKTCHGDYYAKGKHYSGDYNYHIFRLINGNYVVRVNNHLFGFETKHNHPRYLRYDMSDVFL